VTTNKALTALLSWEVLGERPPFWELNSDRVVCDISLGAILGRCMSTFPRDSSKSASREVATQSGVYPDWICKVASAVVTLKLEVRDHERFYYR
jgi:hypothetical protein